MMLLRSALILAAAATMTAPGLENDAWPPSRFVQPISGVNVTFVAGIGDPEINARCGEVALPKYHFGCSNKDEHWIVIVSPCAAPESDDYARQLCHEIAHLNGWPADHPL